METVPDPQSLKSRLLKAIEVGNSGKVAALVAAGVTAHPTKDDHWGALTMAAYRGREAMVRLFLEQGYDPTPALIPAANRGRLTTVRMLLEAGADPNSADEEGMSALHWAVNPDLGVSKGHLRVVRALLQAGADPNSRTADGRTPLFYVHDCDDSVIETLLQGGADINARDSTGLTPLHYASLLGRHGNVFNFVETYDADPEARDERGIGVVGYAVRPALASVWISLSGMKDRQFTVENADREAILADLDAVRRAIERLLADQ